ncbi:serine hydrolase [Mesorhizobium sp. M0684]|uniref:serine hydrolase n=1 Tax=unclassified Mesorhizobium TaxID=325217 RepID=UPI0033385BE4
MKKVAALLVFSLVAMLPAMAAAQSYVPELGPSPPQDAMQLYPGGVEKALAALPDIVKKVREASDVPGFAVAVVHGGKMIFDEGYGLRDNRDDTSKVSSTTIFQVASVSKSISATVAAIAMTKDHSFDWDTPIGKVWDGFRLNLDYVSGNATIGDFFAHRSGLPMAAGDELEDLGFQRKQIVGSLWMVPLDPFRISYHYANFGTTIGAEAVAHAEKQPWELLAKSLLFDPLGMRSSSYRHEDFIAAGKNRALLHARVAENVFEPLFDRDPDQQAPAGGVSSSAQDLAKWMILLLGDGTYSGQPMIDPKILQPAITPQSVTYRGETPDTRASSYGYGFNVGVNANGRTTMGHSGAFLLGAGTTFQILPSADVGIVVLTNGSPVGAAEAVAASFMDIVQYGQVTRDWYPYIKPRFMAYYKPVGDLAGEDKPTNPAKARSPSFYEGQYTSNYFDTATVRADGDKLMLELGPKPMQFTLEHWDGDTYALTPRGENAPTGSLSSVKFVGSPGGIRARVMTVDYLNENGLGHFQR